ncbi:TOBE domain-containing protein, partial [Streptomyces sp. NPDC002454]
MTALGPVDVTPAPDGGTGTGTVVLRPEQLRLAPADGADPDAPAPPTGRVTEIRFHGHDALVLVDVPGTDTVTVRVSGPLTVRPGDSVWAADLQVALPWSAVQGPGSVRWWGRPEVSTGEGEARLFGRREAA